jgi:hypothetical protein
LFEAAQLSKKFAYKPSFIAAVRVNVSDLIGTPNNTLQR